MTSYIQDNKFALVYSAIKIIHNKYNFAEPATLDQGVTNWYLLDENR